MSASISPSELANAKSQLVRVLADDSEALVTWPAEDVMRLVVEVERLHSVDHWHSDEQRWCASVDCGTGS